MIRALPNPAGDGAILSFVAHQPRPADPQVEIATDAEIDRTVATIRMLESGIVAGTPTVDIVNAALAIIAAAVVENDIPIAFLTSTIADTVDHEGNHSDDRVAETLLAASMIAHATTVLDVGELRRVIPALTRLDRFGLLALGHAAHHAGHGVCAPVCVGCESRALRKRAEAEATTPAAPPGGGN